MDVYSLYLFGPLWRFTKCHEYTVGQNRTHDDHAEQCGETEVKEKHGLLYPMLFHTQK